MSILDKVNSPEDLKKLNFKQLTELSEEIREFLIDKVSRTGGHLSPNLGVVELTIAMHYVFNCPVDNFIWDVGHQSYVHKILTGRKDMFDVLRKKRGFQVILPPGKADMIQSMPAIVQRPCLSRAEWQKQN